jgi:8-oxo-dGTP pyrophosphatase MutT (NUDIX family)
MEKSREVSFMGKSVRRRHCGKDFTDELQKILAHRQRRVIDHPALTHAAVLMPLFNKHDDCHILFTRRTQLVKHHKGQISFPGGMFDEDDQELRNTALREAYEEIGLEEKDVHIIGGLDDIVTVTDFIVTPFVAYFPYPYRFKLSEIEIDELIEVPLSFLLDPECFSERENDDEYGKRTIYTYQYREYTIWGATALILKQLLELIPTSSLPSQL